MKLSTLITQANRTYSLGLGDREVVEVYRRLKAAGFRDVVTAGSGAVDAVLTTVDGLQREPRAVYARMKQETRAHSHQCPRCNQSLRVVSLVADRQASYCQGCAITLPLKV